MKNTMTLKAELVSPRVEEYQERMLKIRKLARMIEEELRSFDDYWPEVRLVETKEEASAATDDLRQRP